MLLPKCKCPKCGDLLDAATDMFGGDQPKPGDITVCLHCGHVMAFTELLVLRELTDDERHEADDDARVKLLEKNRRIVMNRAKH